MDVRKIGNFISSAMAKPEGRWVLEDLENTAFLSIPDLILGSQETLLKADVYSLWARWFLESIFDPKTSANAYKGYAFIYQEVTNRLQSYLTRIPVDDLRKLSSSLSRLIDADIRRRMESQRVPLDRDARNMLVDLFWPNPRCWICGY